MHHIQKISLLHAALCLLSACCASSPSEPAPKNTAPLPAPTPTPTQNASISSAKIRLHPVFTDLKSPVFLTHAPDGTLVILEQNGRVFTHPPLSTLPKTPIKPTSILLDISSKTLLSTGGERGLLGLAFSPHHTKDRAFYIYYTAQNGDNTVARVTLNPNDPSRALPSSLTSILSIPDFASNHNGGMIAFGDDKLLYIGTGDGGGGGDPQKTSQNPGSLLGKLLRIDPTPSTTKPYTIPPSNPFAHSTDNLARPEIFALGLRNPWRFSFDAQTRDLYIADVGQNVWEEVNAIPKQLLSAYAPGTQPKTQPKPLDFGWSTMEGNHCFPPQETSCARKDLFMPALEYNRDGGCSITGGYVYRGSAIPSLQGSYIFSDFCSGTLWAAKPSNPALKHFSLQTLLNTDLSVSSFGQDKAGELYVVDYKGTIYRIVADR